MNVVGCCRMSICLFGSKSLVSAQCTYTEFSILEHALADYTYSSQHILRRKCDDVVFQFDGEADLESSKLCHRVRDYSTEKKRRKQDAFSHSWVPYRWHYRSHLGRTLEEEYVCKVVSEIIQIYNQHRVGSLIETFNTYLHPTWGEIHDNIAWVIMNLFQY